MRYARKVRAWSMGRRTLKTVNRPSDNRIGMPDPDQAVDRKVLVEGRPVDPVPGCRDLKVRALLGRGVGKSCGERCDIHVCLIHLAAPEIAATQKQ